MTTVADHPNAERAREYLVAYAAGDLDALAQFLADDIVWRVGGSHPLSGEYRGREEALAYMRRAIDETDVTMRLEPEAILASDDHVAIFLQVRATREGRTLDAGMAQVVKLDDDGRWREFWALSDDQEAIDAFWA